MNEDTKSFLLLIFLIGTSLLAYDIGRRMERKELTDGLIGIVNDMYFEAYKDGADSCGHGG